MTKCSSSDCLEVGELDAYSDVSSERSFGYEFAQAEVMMKGVWSNGESQRGGCFLQMLPSNRNIVVNDELIKAVCLFLKNYFLFFDLKGEKKRFVDILSLQTQQVCCWEIIFI